MTNIFLGMVCALAPTRHVTAKHRNKTKNETKKGL